MLSSRATAHFMIGLAVLLPLAAAGETFVIGPELPDTIATHFGWDGVADGWMSKRSAFVLLGVLMLLVVLPLAFLPILIQRLPDPWINLPHRDYWLAPERREESREYLVAWCAAFAAGTSAFTAWTQHLLLIANLGPDEPRLDSSFGWALAAYFFLAVAGTGALLLRFRRPADRLETA